MGSIGCAEQYTVAVMRQPGNMTLQGTTPTTVAQLDDITALSWNRVDTERGGATIEVAKCPANRTLLSSLQINRGIRIDPWAHEIWIYRDNTIALMGPIVYIRETRNSYIIDVWDMVGWLSRREIFGFSNAIDVPATLIADSTADVNFTPSDPDLVRHMERLNNSSTLVTRTWDGDQWTIYDQWQNLVTSGLRFTTLGRNILIFSQVPPNNTNPYIINADDILGEVEVVKDGINYGNRVIALGEGFSSRIDTTTPDREYYGVVTFPPVRVADSTSQTELDSITQDLYDDLRDLSPELVIPGGSTLASSTEIVNTGFSFTDSTPAFGFNPIALEELVCGMRYDVRVGPPDFDSGQFPMRLGEVQVSWTPEAGEKIAVSLKNLGFAAGL